MMEQPNSMRDRLRLDGGQADSRLSIAAASEVMSNTSASKTKVRDEGMTVLSAGVNTVAE
jgi:hypothetical protein